MDTLVIDGREIAVTVRRDADQIWLEVDGWGIDGIPICMTAGEAVELAAAIAGAAHELAGEGVEQAMSWEEAEAMWGRIALGDSPGYFEVCAKEEGDACVVRAGLHARGARAAAASAEP